MYDRSRTEGNRNPREQCTPEQVGLKKQKIIQEEFPPKILKYTIASASAMSLRKAGSSTILKY